jgi:DNA polymerase-3 subunit delta'
MIANASKGPSLLVDRLLSSQSGVHAVLFYGADGAPTERHALALIQGWLCLDLQSTGSCGSCRSCNAFTRGNHVDFKRIDPKGASALIKIGAITARNADPGEDQEQSLQEFFRTPPLFGNRKIVLVADSDRMNEAASNSLLKMLEEPNEFAKIVLTTTSLGDMLPTVLSRCINVPVQIDRSPEPTPACEAIDLLAIACSSSSSADALMLSERLRAASELFQSEQDLGVRNANSIALATLSRSLLRLYPQHPQWAKLAIEAHRRIVGNANSTLVFDSLFASLLAGGNRTQNLKASCGP